LGRTLVAGGGKIPWQVTLSLCTAQRCLAEEQIDIVIVDIGLSDGNGLDLVKQVRSTGSSGIIVLSGRGEVADRVLGLEFGADDYIVKPFHSRDLLARVRALERRLPARTSGTKNDATREFCGYVIDPTRRRLAAIDGDDVQLTTREFDVLWVLVASAPSVVTREAIVDAAFGAGHSVGGRPVDGLICRLREKLFPDGSGHLWIKTVRGRGYQLSC
jgi:DNA-binding response OmpR family regulator